MTTQADVSEALGRAPGEAAFVAELQSLLGPRYEPRSFAAALDALAATGAVVVTSKPLPDPHLEGMDLRIVARALDAAERHWNAWLSEFLASHRCS